MSQHEEWNNSDGIYTTDKCNNLICGSFAGWEFDLIEVKWVWIIHDYLKNSEILS